MDVLTRDHLRSLASTGGTRISLYMPTHRFGPETLEDQTRLKTLLSDVEHQLGDGGMKGREIDRLLGPARALIDDRPFWLRARDGLAVFVDAEGVYPFRLWEPFAPYVMVAERFALKPLMRALGSERRYWVLALSQKRARLFKGSRYALDEVDLAGTEIPGGLADAVKYFDFEKQSLQFHTGTSGGSAGRRPAVFHGTGETSAKDELVPYFRGIDKGLAALLKGDTAPLVLVGVDYLLPVYREQNSYPVLAEKAITGNPDALGSTDLHDRTWTIASETFAAEQREAAAQIDDLWATARTTNDPEMLVPAAFQGRIDTLFVGYDREWWGSYNEFTAAAHFHKTRENGDEDLLDASALQTLLADGIIYSLPAEEIPHGGDAVALLRY